MTEPEGRRLSEGPAWLPALLVFVVLTPNLRAALPGWTYYFRDFSLSYYPILDFVGAEVRAGRWAFWNPYLYEGSPLPPAFYPFELLHVLWPGPAAVSWLLTLHFPLAAIAMYALARDLGACRYGAFAAGAAYSMCGLTLSSLNVQMFLQVLAWAPLLVLCLRRSAATGGRSTAAAAVCLGLSISTLGVEFALQALAIGVALALATRFDWGAVRRLGLALALGVGLAGLPIALTLGILSGSVRGEGLTPFEALQKPMHPAMLLQLIIPDLAGSVGEPLRYWWGGRFFPHGSPYFMTLYVGPIALCLACVGMLALPRRPRFVLVGAALLGFWYALGDWGGLAPLAAPVLRFFRYPVKAMFAPCFVLVLCAGLGVSRLRRGRGWPTLRAPAVAAAILAAGVWLAVTFGSGRLAPWLAISPVSELAMRTIVGEEASWAAVVSLLCLGLTMAVARGSVPAPRAGLLLTLLLVVDLWRGGVGLNRQVAPRFFEALPELAFHEQGLDGGRMFSFGTDSGPAAASFLEARAPGSELMGFFMGRQVLNPFLNVLDRVELAEGPDRHSGIPNPALLKPWDYRPFQIGRILPVLRNAAVNRILSLDPLEHPDVQLRDRFPAGPPHVYVHVYDLVRSSPRSYLACRVTVAPSRQAARDAALTSSFDPGNDVALEQPASASCSSGRVSRRVVSSDAVEFDVEADGAGYLVARDSWARGWRATVDGRPAPLLRANGRHRAVAIPAGRHQVQLSYHPPGLGLGLGSSALGALLAGLVLARPSLAGR